jgi:hypothetical protein
MASSTEYSELQQRLAQIKPDNLAEIIDKLAGDKDNLRVDVQSVKLHVGKTAYEVNGVVNFNVLHKNNRHWKDKP